MSEATTEEPYRSVEGLRIERRGPVLEFEIDRPKKRNALTDPIVAAMIGALSAAGPDESVRVIVLRGAGDHFCAGFDIVGRNAADAPSADRAASNAACPPKPTGSSSCCCPRRRRSSAACRDGRPGSGCTSSWPPTSPSSTSRPGSGSPTRSGASLPTPVGRGCSHAESARSGPARCSCWERPCRVRTPPPGAWCTAPCRPPTSTK